MRFASPLALIVLAAALLFGCGGSDDSTTTGPHMDGGMPHTSGGSSMAKMRAAWTAESGCRHPSGASRWGCSIGPYRCQAVVVDRGWAVDCAKSGRSISFTIPPRK
ncbi:MAG TPA: hypothetical protein VFJ53_07820 [Solirubrobacterales bacterium]|nr:hypothetical protein [Solirubrobacterales bacterium]